MSISDRSADSEAMADYWQTVQEILQGEDALIAAREKYLPKLPVENEKQYEFRLKNVKFTNIYSDILGTLASKPFEEEIRLVEGEGKLIPEQLAEFVEDVDGEGNNISVTAHEYFYNGINDSISWILIDYPKTDETVRTIADMKTAGIRPYWSIVLAINVLEVRSHVHGGKRTIDYIRIYEPATDDDRNPHVRVFERSETGAITWQLWEIDGEGGKETMVDDGILGIDEIPVVPFITGKRDGKRFVFIPPLKSAVSLQRTLYKQESALEFAKTMTAFPMLSAKGVRPKLDANGQPVAISVGPQTVLYAPPDGDGNSGDWSYVEPSAASLKFLAEDIKETKQDLRELGKQPLTAQAGLTVITTAYAAGKSKSAVKQWGNALKDALENAIVITNKWLGIRPEQYDPELSVYDDYDDLSEEDFGAVQAMRKDRDISRETLWTEARRRGILSAEFDPEAENARLLKELPGDGDEEFDQTERTEE